MTKQKYLRVWAVEYRIDATGQIHDGSYVFRQTVSGNRSDSKSTFLEGPIRVANRRERLWRRYKARTRRFVLVPEDHFKKFKESPND